MNLRWLKQNMLVVAFLAVAVVFIGVIVYLERQSAGRKGEIEGELANQQQQLERLRKSNPPPSAENLQSLRLDREQLQRLNQTLQEEVRHGTIETPELHREIEFAQLMRETITGLEEAATKNHVKTPDAFAYGFSRYVRDFPCRNPPAKPEDCQKLLALLTKQLAVIDRISKLAIASGAEEIMAIRRTEVEPGQGGTDSLAAPLNIDPKALYHTYPFEFQFATSTKALQNFLNSLSKSDWFFAVKSLKVDAELSAPIAATPASGEPGHMTSATPEKPPETKRLLVTARIELIEFPKPEAKPDKPSEKKPTPEAKPDKPSEKKPATSEG